MMMVMSDEVVHWRAEVKLDWTGHLEKLKLSQQITHTINKQTVYQKLGLNCVLTND